MTKEEKFVRSLFKSICDRTSASFMVAIGFPQGNFTASQHLMKLALRDTHGINLIGMVLSSPGDVHVIVLLI